MAVPYTSVKYAADSGRYQIVFTMLNKATACIADVPTVQLSLLISHAIKLIPTTMEHRRNIKALPESILVLGAEAATLRNQCLATHRPDIPAMMHLYATDKGRYAISACNLSYAHNASNPDQVSESLINPADLAATCFIATLSLATFVANFSTGSFGAKRSHHHNTYIMGDGEHSDRLYIHPEADADPQPASDVIAEATPLVQRMLVSAAEHQAAYARLHLEMSKITITNQ